MPDVACPNCAKELQVQEDELGTEHTCEQCGTEFKLAEQPEDSGAPGYVTMSVGQSFQDRGPADSPSDSESPDGGNGNLIVAIVIAIILGGGIFFAVLN